MFWIRRTCASLERKKDINLPWPLRDNIPTEHEQHPEWHSCDMPNAMVTNHVSLSVHVWPPGSPCIGVAAMWHWHHSMRRCEGDTAIRHYPQSPRLPDTRLGRWRQLSMGSGRDRRGGADACTSIISAIRSIIFVVTVRQSSFRTAC